jgi:putative ABC transport system permease protein
MGKTPMWRRYLRFWDANPLADVDTEIAFHLEQLEHYYLARGFTPDQARLESSRRFGNVAWVRSECAMEDRGSVREARRREALDALSQDIRDAVRGLARNPGFTLGAALILALGIGFNTTSFSFNKALLFPSLPIHDASSVVRMWLQNQARGIFVTPLSEGEVADVAAASRSFEDVAAYVVQPVTLTGLGDAERIPAMRATTNLFALLRVSPALGRAFQPEDGINDATAVAIVSDRVWRNRFGADPTTIGRDIVLDGRRHTIVGVMPEDFWFESKDVEVWMPRPSPRAEGARAPRTLMAVARLGAGVNMPAVQSDMHALAQRLEGDRPDTNAGWDIVVTGLLPLGPGERVFFGLVITLTSLLLAAACAHIANLMLARGIDRRGEIAIRAALGARRGRIARQLVVESVALSMVGGVSSLLVSVPIIAQIRIVLGPRTPYLRDLSLDGTALAITGGLVLAAAVLFGLVPTLRLSSITATDAMKQPGGSIAGRRRRPLASALIGLEVTVATFALILTVLFARAANNVIAVPVGFERENVVTFRLDVPDYKYPEPESAARLLSDVHQRLQRLPAIRAAGAGTRLPLNMGPGLPTDAIAFEDRPDIPREKSPWAVSAVVTPGYFEALGVPLLQGRAFESRDSETALPVVVISRSMARAYWPDEDPLGRRLRLTAAEKPAPWLTVIGVVGDVRPFDPMSPQVRQLYLPLAQSAGRALVYFVATRDAPIRRLQDVRLAVRDVDPELAVLDLQTLADAMSREQAGAQLGQASLRMNALIAVLLAILGVYSVVAFAVARRRREIAIRVALGGSRSSIVAMLSRQALSPALIGIAIGVVLSALASRITALVLFGVNPLDPMMYGLACVALWLAAAAASCIPALRATGGSSVVALRAE